MTRKDDMNENQSTRQVVIAGDAEELVDAARAEFTQAGCQVVEADVDSLPEQIDVLVALYSPAESTAQIGATARRMSELIERAAPALERSGAGRIVLASGRDYLGWPGRTAAAADLAAIVGLTRSLALELGQRGITVNAVCPPAELGAVEATEDPWEAPPPPLTGSVTPEDVAFAIAFLADPLSGYLTGQIIHTSGGLSVLSSLTS